MNIWNKIEQMIESSGDEATGEDAFSLETEWVSHCEREIVDWSYIGNANVPDVKILLSEFPIIDPDSGKKYNTPYDMAADIQAYATRWASCSEVPTFSYDVTDPASEDSFDCNYAPIKGFFDMELNFQIIEDYGDDMTSEPVKMWVIKGEWIFNAE